MAEDTFIRLIFFLIGILYSILLDLIVEPIRIRWRKQANYDCKKCKVWDCPAKKCIKKSKYFIIPIILISLFTINVNAKSDVYFSKSVSTIGGKNFGNADNWVGLPASTSTDYALNLTFSFDYSSGYENTIPYNIGDKINVLLTSCVANDHKFTNVYPYTKNYLGVSYISNEYCGFNWGSDNNHVQYTLLQLNVSNTYDDDVESSSGSILIKHFEVKNVNLSIYNSNSWADAVYFINAEVLDNTEYASLLSKYQDLDLAKRNNENGNKINDSINSIDDDTTSSKCGIICKLKGIFTGIANLPSKIGDLLKSLFIPSDEQMSDLLNDTQTQLNSKLGILGLPTSIYTQFLNLLTSDVNENTCIQFDDIKDPVYDQLLIGSSSFCFNTLLQNEKLNTFRTSCLLIVGGLLLLAFVSFLKKQYNRILDINDPDENYEYITSEDSYNIDYSSGEVTGMKHNERKTRREKI